MNPPDPETTPICSLFRIKGPPLSPGIASCSSGVVGEAHMTPLFFKSWALLTALFKAAKTGRLSTLYHAFGLEK
jgi:hypothetical protein